MRRHFLLAVFLLLVMALLWTACAARTTRAHVSLPSTPDSSPTDARSADASSRPAASSHAYQRPPLTPTRNPTATPTAAYSPTPIPTADPNMPLGVAFGEGNDPEKIDHFMDYIHDLGLHRTKVSFYWSQLEPSPDQYDFQRLDLYLDQLGPDDRALVNLFTNGWCTHEEEEQSRKGATLRDCPKGMTSCEKSCEEYYREFVVKVAERVRDRAHGGVAYFQRDTEPAGRYHFPSNEPEAYVALQHIFYQAVKSVLPDVIVIGVNHNGTFSEHGWGHPGSQHFFEYVLEHMRDDFDVLDVRLYEDYLTVPHRVEWFREKMRAYGYEKPVVCTEYGGPDPRTFHEGDDYIFMNLMRRLAAMCTQDDPRQTNRCVRSWIRAHRDEISPKLRPFLGVGSAEENAFREVIHCHDIVQHNLVLLSSGVEATWWWNLRSPGADFVFGQMRLRDNYLNELPGYGCYKQLVQYMNGVTTVQRVDVGDEGIFFFAVQKADGGTMYVAWHRDPNLDPYDSIQAAAVNVRLPIPYPWVTVVDLEGNERHLSTREGGLSIALDDTPLFFMEEPTSSVPPPVVSPRPPTATP